MANGILKVGEITTSSGSGNITIGSGVTLLSNVPAFCYKQNSAQALSANTWTKLTNYGEKLFDTNNAYDSSTGFFTPQVAGKYFFFSETYVDNSTDTKYIGLSKNGNLTGNTDGFYFLRDTGGNQYALQMTGIFELNGSSDTVSVAGYNTSNAENFGSTNISRGRFIGYRIGA